MLISEGLMKKIEENLKVYKETGQDNFPVENFKGLSMFFGRSPKNFLFPLGEMEGVRIYLGSE